MDSESMVLYNHHKVYKDFTPCVKSGFMTALLNITAKQPFHACFISLGTKIVTGYRIKWGNCINNGVAIMTITRYSLR